jgi:hypothetical protein
MNGEQSRDALRDLAQMQQRLKEQLARSAEMLKRAAHEGAMQTLSDEARELAQKQKALADSARSASQKKDRARRRTRRSRTRESRSQRPMRRTRRASARRKRRSWPSVRSGCATRCRR